MNNLIHQLKERRETLKISQETLAELSGIGLRTLKQLESGKGNPTIATLQKLSETLGMEIIVEVKN